MKKRISIEEIEQLYIEYGTPEHVKRHCKGVTQCALTIAQELNKHGYSLDLALIEGAGLCHDVARLTDPHWTIMADKLQSLGYQDEADIVRVHMTQYWYSQKDELCETDMILIGDRLVKEDTYVGIDERFEYIKNKARRRGITDFSWVDRNKSILQATLDDIESIIGMSVDELCGK